ncbi:hypothetical protein CEE36_10540 [candidate division TA06 bacterium B3_TA06]|uniref:PKD domain-containing protein n=1 Tax=candidate division TA06 bacterium B3_TA06 TaxID=2012487 RepID=A0A532UW44_UNCT6|nr:MAG: hypothetical protein CEE36_10540 [candidate division TA06 bacterium B3_TA06]
MDLKDGMKIQAVYFLVESSGSTAAAFFFHRTDSPGLTTLKYGLLYLSRVRDVLKPIMVKRTTRRKVVMKRLSLLLVLFWVGVPLWAAPDNGDVKWQYGTGKSVTSSAAIGSDGTIYVGSWDYYLYAINPDGTLLWRCETQGTVESSPAVGPDGTIYIGSNDGNLYALEGSSQGLASSAWPKFRHDRSNTGRFDYIDPPVADFTADPTSGEAPLTVTFTDQSAGLVTSWYWDFGDSFTSAEQNPIHTYEEWGLYNGEPGGARPWRRRYPGQRELYPGGRTASGRVHSRSHRGMRSPYGSL